MSQTQTVLINPTFSSRTLSCSTSQRSTVGQLRHRITEQYIGIVNEKENLIFEDDERKCLLDDNAILKDKQRINLSLHNYPTYTSAFTKNISNYFNLKKRNSENTERKSPSTIINALFIVAGAIFISVCAQLQFCFPWNDKVPVTFQTFAVLLNGAVQGPWNSSLSCILYILFGLIGLPVYADFNHGYKALTGYTFGFFIGFVFSSLLVGYLSKKGWDKQYRKVWLSMILGSLVIYAFGLGWFTYKVGNFWSAMKSAVLPFIPGDILKIGLATLFLPLGWKLFYFRNTKIELDIEDHE